MIGNIFKGPMPVFIIGAVVVLGVRYLPADEILERLRSISVGVASHDAEVAPAGRRMADVVPSLPVTSAGPADRATDAARAAPPVTPVEMVEAEPQPQAAPVEEAPPEPPSRPEPAAVTQPPIVTTGPVPAVEPAAPTEATPAEAARVAAAPVVPAPSRVSRADTAAAPAVVRQSPKTAAVPAATSASVAPKPAPVRRPAPVVASIAKPAPAVIATPPPRAAPAGLRIFVEADASEQSGLGMFTADTYAAMLKRELEAISSDYLGADAVQRDAPNLAFRDHLADGRQGIDRLCRQAGVDRVLLADVSAPYGGFSSLPSAFWPDVRFTAINCVDGRLHKSSGDRLEPRRGDRFEYQKDFAERSHDFVAKQGYFLRPQ